MENNQQNRFKDAPWFPKNDETVMIGGAGGIGSWLTFFLVKAGFLPYTYDFDKIEEHNLGGQLFRQNDVGEYKVSALQNIIREFAGVNINGVNQAISLESPTHHFCFSAFDNMKARSEFFEVWQKSIENCPVTPIFIDGRLEMEQLQILCVTPDNIDKYKEEYLFADSDVPDAPCTMRQTSHTAAMIASFMVAFFTNHITNIYERETVRHIPFFFEYFVPVTLVNVE